MLNIGLEHFAGRTVAASTLNLGNTIMGADAIMACADRAMNAGTVLDNLITVHGVIAKYGYTKSVEALVGREQAMMASTEGIGEWWAKFVRWIKDLWARFTAWLRGLFNNNNSIAQKLTALHNQLREGKAIKPVTVQIPDLALIQGVFKNAKFKQAIETATRVLDTLVGSAGNMEKFYKEAGGQKESEGDMAAQTLNNRRLAPIKSLETEIHDFLGKLNVLKTDKKEKQIKNAADAKAVVALAVNLNEFVADLKPIINTYEQKADRLVKGLDEKANIKEFKQQWKPEGAKSKNGGFNNEVKNASTRLRFMQQAIKASVANLSKSFADLGKFALSFGSMVLSVIKVK